MKAYILRRPCWLRLAGRLPFFLMAAAVCLLCANIAYVFTVHFAFDAGFDPLHFAVGLVLLFFAVIFAFICFGLVKDCFSQIVVTAQGIERRQFGQRQCFLPWDELAETGVALERWTVKGGPDRCLYFADRQLDEMERAVIDEGLDPAKGGRIITVSCKELQNEEALRRFSPLPIPATRKPQNVKRDLPAWRRCRHPDGSWGEAEAAILPDAGELVQRFRMQKRERGQRRR